MNEITTEERLRIVDWPESPGRRTRAGAGSCAASPNLRTARRRRCSGTRRQVPLCAECKRMVECCCDYGICEREFDRAYAEEFGTGDAENSSFGAMWALEWIPNHMRDMQEAACETFESY